MVSLSGAQAAQPLVTEINAIMDSIAALEAALAASPTIWQMSADVYVGSPAVSQTLALQYDMNATDSQAILNAVLTGLKNELATLQQQLAGIS